MNTKYRSIHNNWDPHLVFPFVVVKFKQDDIYVDPVWGIKVEKISVDGEIIPADDFKAKLDDLNFNRISIGSEPFVYQVRRRYLVFARTFDNNDYELEKYEIPEMAKHIMIEYRLRESNQSVGPVMILESNLV